MREYRVQGCVSLSRCVLCECEVVCQVALVDQFVQLCKVSQGCQGVLLCERRLPCKGALIIRVYRYARMSRCLGERGSVKVHRA